MSYRRLSDASEDTPINDSNHGDNGTTEEFECHVRVCFIYGVSEKKMSLIYSAVEALIVLFLKVRLL